MQQLKETFKRVKQASKGLALLSDQERNELLMNVADAIVGNKEAILSANAEDLAKMDRQNPLYDRLQLTEKRLDDIASDMRNVATLPSPLGHISKQKTLPNGLRLCRVSVPFGARQKEGYILGFSEDPGMDAAKVKSVIAPLRYMDAPTIFTPSSPARPSRPPPASSRCCIPATKSSAVTSAYSSPSAVLHITP